MRLTPVLVILFVNFSFGQELLQRKITVSFDNQSITSCLAQLSRQEKINFSYNSRLISTIEKRVTKSFSLEKLTVVLKEIFGKTPLEFKEIGEQVSIYQKKKDQETVTLSGYVRVAGSKEEIIGARLYFEELGKGCISNAYGYYAITLPKQIHTLTVSSVGMKRKKMEIDLQDALVFNIHLQENNKVFNEVSVYSERNVTNNIKEKDLNTINGTELTNQKLERLSPVAGEKDFAKLAQTLPGVQPSFGGSANYTVRGLGPGNNLILIDEIPIYHPTHLLGFFSIINADAVKSTTFFKDFIPAKYGTRNSSIFQVRTNEGDQNRFRFSGGLSLLSYRANIEGPIKKNVASFYFSARNSVLPRFIYNPDNKISSPSFLDINAKVNWKLNSNNRIYLTTYYGRDNGEVFESFFGNTDEKFYWGNKAACIRWNHTFNAKNFANLSLIMSSFQTRHDLYLTPDMSYAQEVISPTIKYELTTYLPNKGILNYGINTVLNQTINTRYKTNTTGPFLNRSALSNDLFFSWNKRLKPNLMIEAGLRIPTTFHIGQQDTVKYLQEDLSHETKIYLEGEVYDFQFSVDPRIMINYNPNENGELSASLSFVTQQIHLIDNLGYDIPIQVWTNASKELPQQVNHQLSIGYAHSFKGFSFSSILFGRYVRNTPDFLQTPYLSSSTIETNLMPGHIIAGGAELMFKFHPSKYYDASISYSYLNSQQRTPGVNDNNYYPTLLNRPHYFNFNQFLKFSKKWVLSTNIIFHSETVVNIPSGFAVIENVPYPIFSKFRNSQRLPYYSRFDFSATRRFSVGKNHNNLSMIVGVQNIFNRSNPSFFYLSNVTTSSELELQMRGTDLTPFLISITLNFKL